MTSKAATTQSLSTRIARASTKDQFLRVSEKDDKVVISVTAKIDCLETGCVKNPRQVWLQSSRLVGDSNVLEKLLEPDQMDRFQLSKEIAEVINYDLGHVFNAKTIKSTKERDFWGFTEDLAMVKQPRSSYAKLYEDEYKRCKAAKAQAKSDRELNAPSLEDLELIVNELVNNPGCYDIVGALTAGVSLKTFGLGVEQKRPPTKSDFLMRIESVAQNKTFLRVTACTDDGKQTRTGTSVPNNAITFKNINKALEHVFFARPKEGETATGAINFLRLYRRRMGGETDLAAVTKEIKRLIESAPKLESSSKKVKITASGAVTFDRNDLPLEPTSPRARGNFEAPEDI